MTEGREGFVVISHRDSGCPGLSRETEMLLHQEGFLMRQPVGGFQCPGVSGVSWVGDSFSLWWWFSYLRLGRVSQKPRDLGAALSIPALGT